MANTDYMENRPSTDEIGLIVDTNQPIRRVTLTPLRIITRRKMIALSILGGTAALGLLASAASAKTADGDPDNGSRSSRSSGPSGDPSPTAVAAPAGEILQIRIKPIEAAPKDGTKWKLHHPDEDHDKSVTLPDGFTPDKRLHIATDIATLDIGNDLSDYKDWETALNTKRARGPLAGYNYDYNDSCQVPGFYCNYQGDMYAWRTWQGMEVRVPQIGTLVGGPRKSVLLNLLNLDGSVVPWDIDGEGPAYVKRGFTATGRIFDGEHHVDELERNLSGHWLFRQFNGTPEKSYTGITDSPDNALETLLVNVQRKQWGRNPDGSKRMEFQLIRAQVFHK